MIISDHYQFVFVHIPKCAGTSVRKPIQNLDDRDGFYTGRVDHHDTLELLDYVHIPLFVLREYFPEDYEKIHDYWSFAVLRDPFARFPSSISQRMKRYGGKPLQDRGSAEIAAEIAQTIDFLVKQPRNNHLLPAEFIHFQRQVDYIQLDGKRVVDTLYTMDELALLLSDIGQIVGQDLSRGGEESKADHANRTMVHRNDGFRWLIESTRPVTRLITQALPITARQKLRNIVYVPRDQRLQSLFDSHYVTDFICDYYRDDIDLWNTVLQSNARFNEGPI